MTPQQQPQYQLTPQQQQQYQQQMQAPYGVQQRAQGSPGSYYGIFAMSSFPHCSIPS